MKLGCHVQTWGGVRGHPAGVGSLKDLTYVAKPPFAQAIKEARLLGYEGVEVFDGDIVEWHAEGRDIRRAGLELSGVYTGGQFIYDDAWADEKAKFQTVIEAASAMGAGHLIVGGGAVRASGVQSGDPRKFAERLNEVTEMAAKRKIAAHFHPHPNADGYTEEMTDETLAHSDINLTPDLGVLAKGKVEPIGFIKRHLKRISYVHLKDSLHGEDIEVGQGAVDLAGAVKVLGGSGFGGWMVIELDFSESTPAVSHQFMVNHVKTKLLGAA